MKYRHLGRSGLLVSRLCLGTMTFGNKDWGCDQETSSAIVRRFVEGGGNFIDTANGYSGGESERMLGIALKDYERDNLVIATKCWFPANAAPTSRGLSRKHIMEAMADDEDGDEITARRRRRQAELAEGELPPYDAEAT